MTNFNHKKFKCLTDFIIGITEEIWENRQIQSILEYYEKIFPDNIDYKLE